MPSLEEGPKKEIAVSSEMMAVMDALTPRERSIVEALIKRGGRMTQAEIRYETNLPRSTLTTILVSLERRNLNKERMGQDQCNRVIGKVLSVQERPPEIILFPESRDYPAISTPTGSGSLI